MLSRGAGRPPFSFSLGGVRIVCAEVTFGSSETCLSVPLTGRSVLEDVWFAIDILDVVRFEYVEVGELLLVIINAGGTPEVLSSPGHSVLLVVPIKFPGRPRSCSLLML